MEQEPIIHAYIDKLIDKINGRVEEENSQGAKTSTTLDVVEWINYVAFAIIGDLTWGSSFGCLDGLTYHLWIQTVGQFKTAIVVGATKLCLLIYSFLMAITPSSALKDVMEMWKATDQKVRQRCQPTGFRIHHSDSWQGFYNVYELGGDGGQCHDDCCYR
ncbi:hypothetical protein BGW36DRAFT_360742 [Talaromyces proteolyticus]|uniref:Uncharacterized protein n=1 Tax=Talaromyces proteolyticus TaxID=1131652 RepID=A0AAD4KM97_9EURO|nr:uncharacterized protein BGW36DRAFT_360742 [Talaromyces proteolyticus]KAH8695026.1 hypothetical protein BGW36DRAFT_360742 [Talaromyces proteolyticus]